MGRRNPAPLANEVGHMSNDHKNASEHRNRCACRVRTVPMPKPPVAQRNGNDANGKKRGRQPEPMHPVSMPKGLDTDNDSRTEQDGLEPKGMDESRSEGKKHRHKKAMDRTNQRKPATKKAKLASSLMVPAAVLHGAHYINNIARITRRRRFRGSAPQR